MKFNINKKKNFYEISFAKFIILCNFAHCFYEWINFKHTLRGYLKVKNHIYA